MRNLEIEYLSIPTPCNENWDKMEVRAKDTRFCKVCEKCVIDFSEKTPEEIDMIFNINNGNVCGNFSEDQLFQDGIPEKSLFTRFIPKSIAASLIGFFAFSVNTSTAQTTTDTTKTEQTSNTNQIKVSGTITQISPDTPNKEEAKEREKRKKYIARKRNKRKVRFTNTFPSITYRKRRIRGRIAFHPKKRH